MLLGPIPSINLFCLYFDKLNEFKKHQLIYRE